jgi:hypothetical protein
MEFFVPAARCWGSARAPSQSDEKFGRSSAGRAYGQLSPSFNDGSELQCISPPENLDDGIDRKTGSSNRKECLH